jgi:hypothetical protein
MIRFLACAILALVPVLLAAPGARGQSSPAPAPADSAAVRAIGSRYAANWVHRALFGRDYRDLWTAPIAVPVLDLGSFGGGLVPVSRGGGQQTISLRFRAANGSDYYFRSVDKNPTAKLPPELIGTTVAAVVQDQTSAQLPTAPLVVTSLLTAAGVLNGEPHLFILPDDERLGEFRSLAGLVGILEPRIAGTWGGAAEIVNGDELFRRVAASPDDRVDVRALLKARLMDVLVGDWDRHRDQWSWARFGDALPHRWVPIPRDRDFAMVRYEGLVLEAARVRMPQLIHFGPEFGDVLGLTWNGRELDRRFLTEAEWPEWESVVAELQAALGDSVIEAAVRRLPPEFYARCGAGLIASLEARRDALGTVARRFYQMLSEQTEVYATDADETALLSRLDPRTLEVRLFRNDQSASARGRPYSERRFSRDDSREVRIFMGGGRDSVVVEGARESQLALRVIGGDGDDILVAPAAGGGIHMYDTDPGTVVVGHARLDPSTYAPPAKRIPNEIPPRDWGHAWEPALHLAAGPDIGLLLAAGQTLTCYGFRKLPDASQHRFRAGVATEPGRFLADYRGRFRRANSPLLTQVHLRGSGIDNLYFHGFGNEVSAAGSDSYYRVTQKQYGMELSVVAPLGPHVELTAGPVVRYATTDDQPDRYLASVDPYGAGRFGQVGARVGVLLATRRPPSLATSGIVVTGGGSVYPAWWDVTTTYGELHGEATGFLHIEAPLDPAVLLRVGGKVLWGSYPYFDAAFIGDNGTVRLGRENRYAGDTSSFGTAELHLTLAHVFLGAPSDFGIFGLADTGRVYLGGEQSRAWHSAAGGGVWISLLSRANTVSLALAKSQERTSFHFQAGFGF